MARREDWRRGETVGLGKEKPHKVWNRGNKNTAEAGQTDEKQSLGEKYCVWPSE